MSATAKRRRGRPETPYSDLGPRQRLENGTAIVALRADPERPSAPLMRAARAYVHYEHIGLPEPSREAADRIYVAVSDASGACEGYDGISGGQAFWQKTGPTARQLAGQRWLRELRQTVGRSAEIAMLELIVNGSDVQLETAREGLANMAAFWGME